MKKLPLLHATILLTLLASCSSNKPDVYRTKSGHYASKAGRFRIQFAQEPNVSVHENSIAGVQCNTTVFTHSFGTEHHYTVSYTDYPDKLLEAQHTETLFDQTAKTIAAGFGAFEVSKKEPDDSPEYDKAITYTLYPTDDDASQAMVKLIQKGNRIYQVGFAALRNAPPDQEIADYINSFKLIESATKYH